MFGAEMDEKVAGWDFEGGKVEEVEDADASGRVEVDAVEGGGADGGRVSVDDDVFEKGDVRVDKLP